MERARRLETRDPFTVWGPGSISAGGHNLFGSGAETEAERGHKLLLFSVTEKSVQLTRGRRRLEFGRQVIYSLFSGLAIQYYSELLLVF
jgi:hypothetical protein